MDVQLGLRGQLRILIRSIQNSSYALQIHTSSLSPNPRTRDPAHRYFVLASRQTKHHFGSIPSGANHNTDPVVNREIDLFKAYLADTKSLLGQNSSHDPFDEFISAAPTRINNDHLLTWWNALNHHPALKQQALDLFSIPAMSSEIERVFSSTRMLLTAQRQRISDATIEQVGLLWHWMQKGIDSEVFTDPSA
jgi:hypothetical protein